MCNSFNHHPSCTCGFGGDGQARYGYGSSSGFGARSLKDAPGESFIYPTSCPVCGAPVYFYRSPFDGRVFFDELSGDWPKHPCTDTSLNKNATVLAVDYAPTNYFKTRPNFKPGWDILIVDSVYTLKNQIAERLGLDAFQSLICRGRAIQIHRQRNLLIIKKKASKADITPDDRYTYSYSTITIELEFREQIPQLRAGTMGYISQDIHEGMLEVSLPELKKRTIKGLLTK